MPVVLRSLAVAWVFAVAGAAQAQSFQVRPVPTPDVPPGTYLVFDLVRTLQYAAVAAVVLAIPGWVVLRIWAASRRGKDPLKLAMADPWTRAKLEAMSDEERAEFLAQLGK